MWQSNPINGPLRPHFVFMDKLLIYLNFLIPYKASATLSLDLFPPTSPQSTGP